jgi:beta-galactosidase
LKKKGAWADQGFIVCEMQEALPLLQDEERIEDIGKRKLPWMKNLSKRARMKPSPLKRSDQMRLPIDTKFNPAPPPPPPPLSLSSSLLTLESTDGSSSISIDTISGIITSYNVKGEEMFTAPLKMCFYRAPTDNDRGGSGGTSYAARWKAAGLDRLITKPGSCEVTIDNAAKVVKAQWTLIPEKLNDKEAEAAVAAVEGVGVGEVGGMHWLSEAPGAGEDTIEADITKEVVPEDIKVESGTAEGHIRIKLTCRFLEELDNSLELQWEVDTTNALPAPLTKGLYKSLPRVGIEFGVTPGCYTPIGGRLIDNCEHIFQGLYYGRGPHECYSDRKSGALVGAYHFDDVRELHVPYVFPSESGGRCDVLALHLQSTMTLGGGIDMENVFYKDIEIASADPGQLFQFSASPFTVAEFERARHDHELRASDGGCIHVHVDTAHMGVGGDDSWSPTVHEEFLVPPKIYKFGLRVRALVA